MKSVCVALALSLAVSVAGIALADPPPEDGFTVALGGDARIWNPFAGFEACETVTDVGVTATLCLSLDDVVCDGGGHCVCEAALEFSGDLDGLLETETTLRDCTAKVSCTVPQSPSKPVCNAQLKFDASGSVESCDATLSNFTVNGPVSSAGLYGGKAKTQLCVDCGPGQRVCGGVGGLFEYQVNPPTAWSLTVDVDPDPDNPSVLVGDASDTLGFDYTAKGKYNAKTDQSTITLTGVTEAADPESISQGAKIKLEELDCAGAGCEGTATFKVQGNKGNDAPVGSP